MKPIVLDISSSRIFTLELSVFTRCQSCTNLPGVLDDRTFSLNEIMRFFQEFKISPFTQASFQGKVMEVHAAPSVCCGLAGLKILCQSVSLDRTRTDA